MNRTEQEQRVARMVEVVQRRREELHRIPGCAGVAVGLKQIRGEPTGQFAITVLVTRKSPRVPQAELVPAELDGFPTDVVEQHEMEPRPIATDPFARHDPVFGGISVTPWEAPPAWGSIGCFLNTTGDPANVVPAGNYLLTCQHVLANASPGEPRIIQPSIQEMVPPPHYECGVYVAGYLSPTRDCAIVNLTTRGFENTVPNYPWNPGRRAIAGVGVAIPGDPVYKYGATSRFTEGVVTLVGYNPPTTGWQNVTVIRNASGNHDDVWVAKGDSGSVTLRKSDDFAVLLNFAGSADAVIDPPPDLPALPAYFRGFGFGLQSQFDAFAAAGGTVVLA
ncbi:MAG: hypothetical protein ACJ72N_14935 [Labedaea sp.]